MFLTDRIGANAHKPTIFALGWAAAIAAKAMALVPIGHPLSIAQNSGRLGVQTGKRRP